MDAGLDAAEADADDVPDAAVLMDASPPADAAAPDAATAITHCQSYAAPTLAGTFSAASLAELSGLAASHKNPGVLYVHNDSGDEARYFAVDQTAQLLRELRLTGASAVDWEDIAVGPCGAESCVYLGDIGDNLSARTEYAIFRSVEPSVAPGSQPTTPTSVSFERFPFVYPDGAHNAETLLVHPSTGDLYVVLKVLTTVGGAVYRFPKPLTPNVVATLEKVGDFGQVACGALLTGGDIHPAGDRVLLRGRAQVCELKLTAGAAFDTIFAGVAAPVPVGNEVQGEAVGYAPDGAGYFTTSESAGAPLLRVACDTTSAQDAGTDAASDATVDAATPCGNHTIDTDELCDSEKVGTETCVSQGFRAGALRCSANCMAYSTAGCSNVRVNEVESNPSPDWIELYNPGPGSADISGYFLADNAPDDLSHRAIFPPNTIIQEGGFLTLSNPPEFTFGLGAPDSASLYEPEGAKIDEIAWTTHATGTLARCPNMPNNVVDALAQTKNAANATCN